LVDLIACTCVVYAWDATPASVVEVNNDFAMSIRDFDEIMPILEEDPEEPSNVGTDAFHDANEDDLQKDI
jgi:hypothetical protein